MNISYVNAWINPVDFEGAVNQELEIVGCKGRVFVDQQDRGMRYCIEGSGTRTMNPHFQAEVPRAFSHDDRSFIGYGKDSIITGLQAASRVVLGLSSRDHLAGTYPDAESAVTSVAILEAARQVALANYECLKDGKGAPVSAVFDGDDYKLTGPRDTRHLD